MSAGVTVGMSEMPLHRPIPPADSIRWIRQVLEGVFEADDITIGAMGGRGIRIRGHFLVEPHQAYERLAPLFRQRGHTVLFRHEDDDGTVILVMEGVIEPTPNNRWLPIVLAITTVISMLFTYTFLFEGAEPTWAHLGRALPRAAQFTASLLAILVAHE
ncbi:MAG TPA: hypothetical protein GX702_09580, partial [Chloroflexi bacterium]|nr:hypothetical protein [Chloroflexota bacterium]